MQQQQVNKNNNNISSALDCSESRTVCTISTKQPTIKVPPLTGAYLNNAVAQSQTRALRRKTLMKAYALLPIICIIICAQISTTSGRTLLGRKQILHSFQNRIQHHKNLMHHEHENAPKHTVQTHTRHHMNVRSIPMDCQHVESLRDQSMKSNELLSNMVDSFANIRFNKQTAIDAEEEWRKHNLSLVHPYNKSYTSTLNPKQPNHRFNHLDGRTMSEELLKEEITKISKTLKSLKIVYDETVTKNNTKEWQHFYGNDYSNFINFLNSLRTELNVNENLVNHINKESRIEENFTAEYNRTVEVREWLLVVESISFFRYLTHLCEELMKKCN